MLIQRYTINSPTGVEGFEPPMTFFFVGSFQDYCNAAMRNALYCIQIKINKHPYSKKPQLEFVNYELEFRLQRD